MACEAVTTRIDPEEPWTVLKSEALKTRSRAESARETT